jgi:hypothetical protein
MIIRAAFVIISLELMHGKSSCKYLSVAVSFHWDSYIRASLSVTIIFCYIMLAKAILLHFFMATGALVNAIPREMARAPVAIVESETPGLGIKEKFLQKRGSGVCPTTFIL